MFPGDTYVINNVFVSSMSICPITAYDIQPWTGLTNSGYESNVAGTYVTTPSTSASTSLVVDIPVTTTANRDYKFRVRATAEGGAEKYTDPIWVKHINCIYGIDYTGMTISPSPSTLEVKEASDATPLTLSFKNIVKTSPSWCFVADMKLYNEAKTSEIT